MFGPASHSHPVWNGISAILGIGYFTAWSVSFYPQLILNYKRKRTDGLSPDFVILNPLGFLYLTIYNFSLAFSPLARSQYASRHHGNYPEVSFSDLAFSLHALLISLFTVVQVVYYNLPPDTHLRLRKLLRPGDERLRERERLLPLSPPLHAIGGIDGNGKMGLGVPSSPLTPTILGVVMLTGIGISTVIATGMLIWGKNLVWLDWLYFLSSVKLAISTVKWVPQVWLNARLKSGEGFAIGGILCDLTGAVLSFLQLVISSVFITHDPSGIIANPAKLGLSGLSVVFDFIFILQHYVLYRGRRIEDADDEDEDVDDLEGRA